MIAVTRQLGRESHVGNLEGRWHNRPIISTAIDIVNGVRFFVFQTNHLPIYRLIHDPA